MATRCPHYFQLSCSQASYAAYSLSVISLLSAVYLQIEHLGTVSTIDLDGRGCTLTISNASPILGDCHVGDSIAVNGACLTVTTFNASERGGWFQVWLANETLERTDLGARHEENIGGSGILYRTCTQENGLSGTS